MAALVHHINQTQQRHVVTVENPIEFLHRDLTCSVTQREVGVDTDPGGGPARGAAAGSRRRRHWRVRDADTIDTAIKAAETGLLVSPRCRRPMSRPRSTGWCRCCRATSARSAGCASPRPARIVAQQLLPTARESGKVVVCEVLLGTPDVRAALRETARNGDLKGLMAAGNAGRACRPSSRGSPRWYRRADHRRGGARRHPAGRPPPPPGVSDGGSGPRRSSCRRAGRGRWSRPSSPHGREAGTPGAEAARTAVGPFLSELGYTVQEQPFRFNAGVYRALPVAGALLVIVSLLEILS